VEQVAVDPVPAQIDLGFDRATVAQRQETRDRRQGMQVDAPERFFQMGMAEQLLFGVAAGHGRDGTDPVRVDVFGVRRQTGLRLHL
jgi:hypothetical protein